MKVEEYLAKKRKLNKLILLGKFAEEKLNVVIYMKQRRKLMKTIRRASVAKSKLEVGHSAIVK